MTDLRARRIALVNQKGGVGKSALSLNLGGALAEDGDQVLVVDWDPQGHLTEALKLSEGAPPAILPSALMGRFTGDARELAIEYRPRLHVIPTHPDMFLLPRELYMARDSERRLDMLLDVLDPFYDTIIIDCPPELGVLTDSALWSARRRDGAPYSGVVIPVQAEDSSLRALRLLLGQIASLEQQMRATIDLLGMVVNLYDPRRGRVVTTTLDALQQLPQLDVLSVVGDRTAVREAWRAGLTVVEHAPTSEAAGWFRDLGKQIRAAA